MKLLKYQVTLQVDDEDCAAEDAHDGIDWINETLKTGEKFQVNGVHLLSEEKV